jgi:MoaA/NifB/PqqE/SkfB family radical SAM enzyme
VCGKRAKVVKGISSGALRIISWNITLRCPLKCAHCYVDAGEQEAGDVLSTEEAYSVIDQIKKTGKPIVVLSGGEPLLREDIFAIAQYGTEQGLRMVMGTSGYFLDQAMAKKIHEAGIKAVAISIDSADPANHDAFRGVNGVWERAVQAIQFCQNEGIGVQINMSVMRSAFGDVEDMIEMGTALGVHDYQLFFPVPIGRAREIQPRSSQEYEDLIRQILIRYRTSGLNIRPTCSPQFRRIASEEESRIQHGAAVA